MAFQYRRHGAFKLLRLSREVDACRKRRPLRPILRELYFHGHTAWAVWPYADL